MSELYSELSLSGLSSKDKPWDYHRDLSDRVRDLYRNQDFAAYAERIADCAKWLEFALTAVDSGELVFKLQNSWFCRVRHCPVCQWRRSLMWKARFIKALPEITTAYPTARWVFLTLTVKNCEIEDLRQTLSHMNKSWERLSKRKIFPALGYVKSFEVTRNLEDGTAHPHFHVLMLVPSSYFGGKGYIKQEQWRELWQKALRVEYDPWIDIRAIKPKKSGVDLLGAVKETLKYSVKGEDLVVDANWLVGLTHQLHKTRAVALGGVVKNYLSEQEAETEELIHASEDETESETLPDDPRWLFGWREMVKRYMGQPKDD